MNPQTVLFQDLGMMPYKEAWDYQEALLQQNLAAKVRRREEIESPQLEVRSPGSDAHFFGDKDLQVELPTRHHLLFVEHPPVYTLGKSGKIENVLISDEERSAKGIEFFRTNRGGDITFHGPEQIVGYPIFDLEKFYTDIGRYLRDLEEVIIRTLAAYGVVAGRSPGETGVWLDATMPGSERKICAMGVRCSRWVTMHGFALNVNTDLSYFNHIIPCGIQNKKVTSLQAELGQWISTEEVKERLKTNIEAVFEVRLVNGTLLSPQSSVESPE